MPLSIVYSRVLTGVQAREVAVEVHIANGLPSLTIVGLPDTEVKESRERVRAAIQTSGLLFPTRRITVNLAPADLPKDSGRFDLAIALGILAASNQIKGDTLCQHEFAGELALSGELRAIRGSLIMALEARRSGRALVLPYASAQEAALVCGVSILPASHLLDVCAHVNGTQPLSILNTSSIPATSIQSIPDLADVVGQHSARLALELAAAGAHSVLLIGPPGAGKSMLAARLPSLLPDLLEEEALEAAMIQSLSSEGFHAARWKVRPFRSPHHTLSAAAMVGGGAHVRPGEVSLAHHGVLFLDELPEFNRQVLEVLREPLETGMIHLSRAARQATYPARFQLIAAMNPCPCGYYGYDQERCRCSPEQIRRYRGKISGPLVDRIDLRVALPALTMSELANMQCGESSAVVRQRVVSSHQRQLTRQGKPNAFLSAQELDTPAMVSRMARTCLVDTVERLSLSLRSFHRILRVARTIADREEEAVVLPVHVLQAIQLWRCY